MSNIISIITPIKNGSELFRSTYQSVIEQSYKQFEWIIIDDGSDHSQIQEIKKLIRDGRVKYVVGNNNLGPGGARNIGLDKISGQYLTFIDSDDLWDKNFLKVLIQTIKSSKYGVVFSGYRRYVIENNDYLEDFIPTKLVTSESILRGSDVSCLTALVDIKYLNDSTLFGNIPARNDLVFFFRVLKNTNALPIKKTLATYRIKNKSVSSNKLRAMKWQFIVNKKYAKKSIFASIINVSIWALYGLKKYRK